MRMSGNTVFVTGGTSGIGRALAHEFHARGNRVIVAGRWRDRLAEMAETHPGMATVELDVADAAAIEETGRRLEAEFPKLNVFVNNAGISRQERLTDGTSPWREIVETNVVSVLALNEALLPLLMRNPNAAIVATTSGLAFVPRHNFPTYCATKAFLHSWLQSLRFQLRASGVEVLELAPPYVQTELGGPGQLTDPHAMPLSEYVAEVMVILERGDTPEGEILVKRVEALRFAERTGTYAERYAMLNPG